jgi:VWFA-related protein
MNRLAVCGIFLLTFCVFAQTGSAQSGSGQASVPPGSASKQNQQKTTGPRSKQKPFTMRVTTNVVLVPVMVKDARGDLVADLQQSDFRIFQDGVEQKIRNFWDQAFPVSAVVLLDDDLPAGESKKVRQSLDSIAAGFSASDEVALVRFDEYPKMVMNFTANNDALFAQLKEIRTNSKDTLGSRFPDTPSFPMTDPPRINGHTEGGAADIPILGTNTNGVTKHLDDAVHFAAEMLRTRPRDRRKIIFIVSDGTNDRNNKWSFRNTLQLLLSSNISVYAIDVDSRLDALTFQGKGRLTQYAVPTGGDVIAASGSQQIERLYSKLTDEARNQYTLGFEPTKTVGRGNYHTIEVRVERPGLVVTAREGYFAEFPR